MHPSVCWRTCKNCFCWDIQRRCFECWYTVCLTLERNEQPVRFFDSGKEKWEDMHAKSGRGKQSDDKRDRQSSGGARPSYSVVNWKNRSRGHHVRRHSTLILILFLLFITGQNKSNAKKHHRREKSKCEEERLKAEKILHRLFS